MSRMHATQLVVELALLGLATGFLAGLLVVAAGAATVLIFGPRGHVPAPVK